MTAFVRALLILALPFVLVWAFVETLLIEIAGAFKSAWLDVRINAADFRRIWNDVPDKVASHRKKKGGIDA